MAFNSYNFMFFFPVVVGIYLIIPRKIRYIWLLVCSYYFYMCWNPKYAILIAISTIITYISGILLEKVHTCSAKKWIVAGSFVINIGILVFFKYTNFIITSLNLIFNRIHINQIPAIDILLPVGISFYTFQALSYTIDVYRGNVKTEKNILKYALFVVFFPQLVAGPIERSENLLLQIRNNYKFNLWNKDNFYHGLTLMLWGFFQKLVIADRISIFVDNVYSSFWMYGTVELVLATVFFSIQIYCDFGSYSLIAIGAAKVMGFELMKNFNTPYFAETIKDYWRRWHISLSTWFKDYLYIPLGGSRCSRLKKYRNIMITFLISGLWHGASWSFIVWGGLHGIYQVMSDILTPLKDIISKKIKINKECMSYHLGRIFVTFMLTSFAWIFFRMNSLSNAVEFIKRMFTRPNFWVLHDQSLFNVGLDRIEMEILFVSLLILIIVDIVKYKYKITIDKYLQMQNLWFRWGMIIFILVWTVIFGIYGPAYDPAQFIYFQF